MSKPKRCELCGTPVILYSGKEGTNSYISAYDDLARILDKEMLAAGEYAAKALVLAEKLKQGQLLSDADSKRIQELERSLEEVTVERDAYRKLTDLNLSAAESAIEERDRYLERMRELEDSKPGFEGEANLILQQQCAEYEKALKDITANRYGLQGLTEDGASDQQIAEYWASECQHSIQVAREVLAKWEKK